jgi:very-short-patch-repair endonuclease
MLAIEVDGESHHSAEAQRRDVKRQGRLEKEGVRFIRIDDQRLKRDIDKVVDEIKAWIVTNGRDFGK